MRKQKTESKIKRVRYPFPWMAVISAIVADFLVAKHVLQHNGSITDIWELYLAFALLVVFIFTVGFFLLRREE